MLSRRVRRELTALVAWGFWGLLVTLPVITGPSPPLLDSPSYLLMDPESGEVIYGRNIHAVRAPASITKVMTALLAMENGAPGDLVTISHRADAEGGSSLGLCEGERIPLADLTCAMMVRSGNDAAVAIAEHIAGNTQAFCRMMNRRADELDMCDTHFTNPNGMPDDGHVSTAFDLALLAREAMKHPEFRGWVSSKEAHFDRFGDREDVLFETTNHLLDIFPLADGVKTGYTIAAGFCVVATATYRGKTLLAVVLGCERNRQWPQCIALFDYGFTLYDPDYQAFRELYDRGAIF
jgi:D-alanyl-D-alanine carboxypeptidase (penicillin-binding protein 5/6)